MTVEMKNGEIYRGHLNEAEDTMNCFMTGGGWNDPIHLVRVWVGPPFSQ